MSLTFGNSEAHSPAPGQPGGYAGASRGPCHGRTRHKPNHPFYSGLISTLRNLTTPLSLDALVVLENQAVLQGDPAGGRLAVLRAVAVEVKVGDVLSNAAKRAEGEKEEGIIGGRDDLFCNQLGIARAAHGSQ